MDMVPQELIQMVVGRLVRDDDDEKRTPLA